MGDKKNYGEMTQSSTYNILPTNSLFEYIEPKHFIHYIIIRWNNQMLLSTMFVSIVCLLWQSNIIYTQSRE